MNKKQLVVLAVVLAAIAAFFAFDLGRFFTLESIQGQREALLARFEAQPLVVAAVFFAVYIAVTALSLPGAALLTLLAGAIFGLIWGTILVSFASSIGATLAFLVSRFLLRDWSQRRFGKRLEAINRGVEREGAFYLFTLRLVPVFPFWLVNLLMGLTPIRTTTFYWVSQVGMLLGTVVYVNVGTQLAQLESLSGILSPAIIGSFVALGLLPIVAKRLVDMLKARKVYDGWTRPTSYDRNMVVIGAGSAGLVSSLVASAVKAKVTLIESHKMGGDCLNYGCVPSKALLKSAKVIHTASHARQYGLRSMAVDYDFAEVMERVARVVREIEPHDSVERYTGLGVDVVLGRARIVSPWQVEVALHDDHGKPTGKTQVLTTRNIVLATGAEPLVPPIPGLEEVGYLTSDTVWGLRERPRRLLVLGGGPIGCELAQAFNRLGCNVVQVERAAGLMTREDPEIAQLAMERFVAEGIDLRLGHEAVRFEKRGEQRVLIAKRLAEPAGEVEIEFDVVLCALGRKARVKGFGLEELGIAVTDRGTIEVDEFLRTRFPNIFAAGDVAGPYQFTHTASHMAWFASVNALFGRFKRFKVDYSVIPWATFTEPEIARVGINEIEARAKGIEYEVTRFPIAELDRAIADEAAYGVVKILTVPGKDTILGVTIAGEHAGDLIAEFVAAMKHGLGLKKIISTIHIYPTLAESNKFAAGEWQKAHVPHRLLSYVRRYHDWMRGKPSAQSTVTDSDRLRPVEGP